MDETLVTWGENIRARREELGINQYQLAELLGVRQPTVWRWEKGQMEPRRRHKSRLAEVLEAEVRVLFPLEPTRAQ
jgi:transcriptional regulator with XRE-family HTH domain